MSRNAYVAYQDTEIIGRITVDDKASRAAKRHNQAIDKRLSEEHEHWWTAPSPPLLVTLHEDSGKLPARIVMELPREMSLSLILRRLAIPIANLATVPDAVIECTWADIGLTA